MQAPEAEQDAFASINVTPLTDVLLVLLIIFLITGSALTNSSDNLSLPSVRSRSQVEQSGVFLEVEADGQILVSGVPVQDLETHFLGNQEKRLIIRGHRELPFEQIHRVMLRAPKWGFGEVVLAADLEKSP